jgi:hypothetical protein
VSFRLPRQLARDERGAIALMAVFMAIFLVAAVAYVQGIGAAVLQREQMQDAADAAAFSSAVLHARGMNVLSLLNMLMAALLAILVALKLVDLLTTIAIVVISVIAFFNPGAAVAIPPLGQLKASVQQVHIELSPGIHTALEAMHVAARGVRTLIPVVSQARAAAVVASQPDTPAWVGFAVPMRATLPTQDGTFSEVCGKAGDYVSDLTRWFLNVVPVSGEALDVVTDAMSDLVKSRSDWFCGDEGGSPPKTKTTHRYVYPQLPARVRCESIHPDQSGYKPDTHAALCAEAERDEEASEPDAHGECAGPSRVGGEPFECDDPRHPYHRRAALARKACSPEADRDRDLRKFQYQERSFTRTYRFERGHWKVVSTDAEERAGQPLPKLVETALRPCGRKQAPIDSPWNDGGDASGDARTPTPVCSDAAPPSHFGREGERYEMTHHEVTRVFRCVKKVTTEYEVPPDEGGQAAEPASEVPQRLLDGVVLGADPFQVRAVVVGAAPSERPLSLLRLASWPDDGTETPAGASESVGRIAVAQAEYFFDGPEDADPASYLWSMRWQARLRRFSWPGAEGDPAVDPGDAGQFGAGSLEVSFDAACRLALAAARVKGDDPCTSLRERADEIVH